MLAIQVLAWVIAFVVGGWALYKAIEGGRDLYYETFPIVEAAGSASSGPFELPFSVRNPSGWLPMMEVKWSTQIVEMRAPISMTNVILATGGDETIRPLNTKLYRVPIAGLTANMVQTLRLNVVVNYKTLWFDREPSTTEFTWLSGQWIKGRIVR